jgi:hypothetical protein
MPKNGCGIFGNGNIIILDFKKGRDFFFSILKIRVDFGSEIIFDVRNKNVSFQEDAMITFAHCML